MKNTIMTIDIDNKHQLKSLARITNIQKRIEDNKRNPLNPYLEKGNIVLCDFTGLGKELDLPHYAIVWESIESNENINIIPLTSKIKNESKSVFGIGKIKNFMSKQGNEFINKNSYVYLNKLMEVSRSRVKIIFEENIHGTKIRNKLGKLIPLKLDTNTIKTISNSIKLLYASEGVCLVDLLATSYALDEFVSLDSLSNKKILDIGFKLIDHYRKYEFDDEKFLIFYVNEERYSLTIKKINFDEFKCSEKYFCEIPFRKNFKQRKLSILNALFSKNTKRVKEAEKIVEKFYSI